MGVQEQSLCFGHHFIIKQSYHLTKEKSYHLQLENQV